jgi:hypothetical protein
MSRRTVRSAKQDKGPRCDDKPIATNSLFAIRYVWNTKRNEDSMGARLNEQTNSTGAKKTTDNPHKIKLSNKWEIKYPDLAQAYALVSDN